MNQQVHTTEEQLKLKVNIQTFNDTKDYINTLCKYKDLKLLYDKVLPPIKNFEENMITLEKDMKKNQEIIRR